MSLPLAVYPTAERYVFEVRSETNPRKRYRVDVMANGGAGWCECPNFGVQKQDAIDRGKPMLTAATMCKHLTAANHVFHTALHVEVARLEAGEG